MEKYKIDPPDGGYGCVVLGKFETNILQMYIQKIIKFQRYFWCWKFV